MYILVNSDYSGFTISTEEFERFRTEGCVTTEDLQLSTDKGATIDAVEIPDDATDWRVIDGRDYEHVIYVQDGIIHDGYETTLTDIAVSPIL